MTVTHGKVNNSDNFKSPVVTIVTTVFNGEEFLEETIESVLSQNYENIEYVIIDAGSTDRTIEIIKKYEHRLAFWLSEPDNGMYEGINKGFSHSKGEIMCYLNSDDKLHPGSIDVVVELFLKNPEVQWITGIGTISDVNGRTTYITIPKFFFRQFIKMGLYRPDIFGSIQQESTFWRRELYNFCGGINPQLQYAGDYYLWVCFSEYAPLYQVQTILGSFRYHSNQKSLDISKYCTDCQKAKPIRFIYFWKCLKLPVAVIAIIIAVIKINRVNKKSIPGEPNLI